jgi:hypothetical protein
MLVQLEQVVLPVGFVDVPVSSAVELSAELVPPVTVIVLKILRSPFNMLGLMKLRRNQAPMARMRPMIASVMTFFAFPVAEVFPALVRYIAPPMVIMNIAAMPTAQRPNL